MGVGDGVGGREIVGVGVLVGRGGGGGRAAEFFEEVGEAGHVHVDVGCGGVSGLEVR